MSVLIKDAPWKPMDLILKLGSEAYRRSPLLLRVSVGHMLLLPMMIAFAALDERTVMGIDPWVKPIKFALANAVYLLTIGWLFYYLPESRRIKRRVEAAIAGSIIIETALITLQAARATSSHFNFSSPISIAIFAIMGLMILLNTIMVVYLAMRFWRTDLTISPPYLWGIRLGFLIFILANLEGFVMIGLMSHSVGVADGGAGLPLINWNTRGGDLRIAHFVGMHALQVLPAVGYLLSLPGITRYLKRPLDWLWATGIFYAALALFLFLQAMAGHPLFFGVY
jgi:hypothetical protein